MDALFGIFWFVKYTKDEAPTDNNVQTKYRIKVGEQTGFGMLFIHS